MRIGFFLAAVILVTPGALPEPTLAQGTDSLPQRYSLQQGSQVEIGCQGPCACPVMIRGPLRGTFTLVPAGDDGLFRHYLVENVDWTVDDGVSPQRIVGSGTYRIGGEVAIQHQLVLDLTIGEHPPEHFDSGLQATTNQFPKIEISAAVHGFFCWDTVVTVRAAPDPAVGDVGGGGRRFGLQRARPNPFAGGTDVDFALPAPATVELRVFDLAGRMVRSLSAPARLEAGPHSVRWDGRGGDGREAPAGAYLVRLDAGAARSVMRIVKLE